MSKTLQKTFRASPAPWAGVENAAPPAHSTANQRVIELAIEARGRRAGTRTAHAIHRLHA